MADQFDDPDDPVPNTTGGARAAHAAAAARMKSFPGSAAAAIDAASKDQPAAGTGSHPGADEDAGSPLAGDATDEDADVQAAQPRDQAPRDKQPRTLEGADEDAPPSGEDKAAGKGETNYEKWLARFNGDQEAAALAAFENDTKLATLAKQKGAPAKADQAPTDGTEEEAPADQEVNLEEIEAKVTEDLVAFRQTDSECMSWNEQFIENSKRIDEILKFELYAGQPVPTGGELVNLERKLHALKAQVDPKSYGIETTRELDTVELEDLREQIKDAERDKKDLIAERRNLLRDNKEVKGQWRTRLQARAAEVRDYLSSHADQQRAAESDSDAEAAATQEWNTEFDRVTQGLPKERRAEAKRELLAVAQAVYESEGDIPKFGPWMDRQIKPLRVKWDRQAGHDDKRTAKDQERTTRQPAPRGAAATAEADRTRHANPREARRNAERRAAALAKGVGARPSA